jgi:DNA-binding NarL/FixJ family response regulator
MQALTSREREVAKMVASGYSNYDVANMLGVSVQTVKNHLQSIFRKMALANRVELAIRISNGEPKVRYARPKRRKRI